MIRNKKGESSEELVAEKELSAYSRFTRTNYAVCSIPLSSGSSDTYLPYIR